MKALKVLITLHFQDGTISLVKMTMSEAITLERILEQTTYAGEYKGILSFDMQAPDASS